MQTVNEPMKVMGPDVVSMATDHLPAQADNKQVVTAMQDHYVAGSRSCWYGQLTCVGSLCGRKPASALLTYRKYDDELIFDYKLCLSLTEVELEPLAGNCEESCLQMSPDVPSQCEPYRCSHVYL